MYIPGVVVNMYQSRIDESLKSLASIITYIYIGMQVVNSVFILRIDKDVCIIERTTSDVFGGDQAPMFTTIFGFIQAILFSLYERINNIRLTGSEG